MFASASPYSSDVSIMVSKSMLHLALSLPSLLTRVEYSNGFASVERRKLIVKTAASEEQDLNFIDDQVTSSRNIYCYAIFASWIFDESTGWLNKRKERGKENYLFIRRTSTWPLCSQSFSSSWVGLASCLPAR